MSTEVITARIVAARLSKALGRPISPKAVRGKARGDAGRPAIARYGADVRGAYAHHAYTPAEANRIMDAFTASHERRTGTKVRVAPFGVTRKPKAASVPQAAPQDTSDAQ